MPGPMNPSGKLAPLKRAIQQEIENPLSKHILEGRFGPKDGVLVMVRQGELVFEKR